jgi:hypothetical protein
MIRFMTFDPSGIGNELHNCPRNKGAIAVRLRLNPALSPAFYEQPKQRLAFGDTNVALEIYRCATDQIPATLHRLGKAKPIRDRNALKCLAL